MSTTHPGKRPVYLPDKNFHARPLPLIKMAPTSWQRIHLDCHAPVFFSLNPNHRFSPPDGTRSVMYAARDFDTAFMEVFGDQILSHSTSIASSRWLHSMVSTISTPKLQLCDCTTPQALTTLQTDLASLSHNDLSVPQTWSREIMKHPDAVDGIFYQSRFTGRDCIALFDTVAISPTTPPTSFQEHGPASKILDNLNIALV